jgi:putative FmdB family regulatory protein
MKGRTMPAYDYKCKECGKVFEVFRRFSDYDKEIKCPSCGSNKAERIFSVPQISGETVTGFGFKDEPPPSSPGGGMGRGVGRGPRDGRGMGREGRRS